MITVQLCDCERRAQTISAIKYLRELRGLELGDAKALIDEVYYHRRPVGLEFVSEPDARVFVERMKSFGFSCRYPMESALEVFRQTLAATGDNIEAVRTIRERFGLSTQEAKEIMLQSDGSTDTLDQHEQRFVTPVKTFMDNRKPS